MKRAIVLAACLLLLAGCGNGEAASGQGNPAATATTQTAAPTTPPPPPSPRYAVLPKHRLTKALLDVADLPPGYSRDRSDPSAANHNFCDYQPPFEEKTYVFREFSKGGGFSTEILRLGLREYGSPAKAQAAFDAMAKELKTCRSETYQGAHLKYAVMSAPHVGKDSIGVKITVNGNMTLLQNYALVGPTLVTSGGGGLMNANADQIGQLLQDQVRAYQRAARE